MPKPRQRSRLSSLVLDAHAIEVLFATEPDVHFAPHWHEAWSVGAIVSGVCRFACDGQSFEAHEGDVIVMPPFAVHTAGVSARRFEMVMLYVPTPWVAELMQWPADRRPADMATVRRDESLAQALPAAARSKHAGRIGEAVVQALRGASSSSTGFVPVTRIEPRLQALCDSLQADDPPSADMGAIASRLGMSREHFQRLFRRAIGLTPLEYARLARMARAKRLLLEGLPPSLVAADCGFADQAHFSRWFRRYFGVTPGGYGSCMSEAAGMVATVSCPANTCA